MVGVPVCEEMEEKRNRDVVALIVDIKFVRSGLSSVALFLTPPYSLFANF